MTGVNVICFLLMKSAVFIKIRNERQIAGESSPLYLVLGSFDLNVKRLITILLASYCLLQTNALP